jgi:hypothetical protein
MTGRSHVVFSWVLDGPDADHAYRWHADFARGNPYILPRSSEEYRKLIDNGQVLSAKSGQDILGLTYYKHEPAKCEWELGGLMVAKTAQKKGIGATLGRVALGGLLFAEQPYTRGDKVVAHVHAQNNEPRQLLTAHLKFKQGQPIRVPATQVPGLEHDGNGIVHGLEFELDARAAQVALADWCRAWQGTLSDQTPATIELGLYTLDDWATVFLEGAAVAPASPPQPKRRSSFAAWLASLLGP